MSYIGNNLQVAYPSYRVIDDISSGFNGVLKTFALRVAGSTPIPFPINPQQCLLSVNNIVQKPDSTGVAGFTLTGSNIVFATAPTAGWSFFGTVLAGADYVNVGANFPSGTAAVPSVTFDESTGTGLFLASSNVLGIATSGVQQLTVDSSGNVSVTGGISSALGTAVAPAYRFTGDPNTGIYSPGADQVAISTNGTGRLFIDSSGRVGIGTSAPDDNLQVTTTASNSTTGLTLSNTTESEGGGSSITFKGTYGAPNSGNNLLARIKGFVTSVTGSKLGNITFETGSNNSVSERLRIDSSGRVGIGTTGPNAALDVRSATTWIGDGATDAFLQFNQSATAANRWHIGAGSGNALIFYKGTYGSGSETARIDSSGRLLVGTSTSGGRVGATFQIAASGSGYLLEQRYAESNASGADVFLTKSRGSIASPTVVSNGDNISIIRFSGYDGASYLETATIASAVDGTPGANDMPGRLVFSTTADGASSPTERMRITSQGNVLIGSTVDGIGKFGVAANTNTTPGNRVALFTSTYTGGDSAYESIGIVKNANDTTTSNTFQAFYINGGFTICGKINANGAGAAAFGSTSDSRLKENIVNLEPQLHNICALRPVEFDYIKSEGGGHQIGFIAQEIESVYPDAVSEQSNGMKVLTGWSKTEARLVKALQEAVERIETLEARLTAAGIE